MGFIRTIGSDTRGATSIEYGLIVALIVIAMFGALSQVGTKTISMWTNVSSDFNSAG